MFTESQIAPPTIGQAWFLAARPKTLTASFVPVMVAASLAWMVQGHVHLGLALLALLSSLLIQIGTNLINDALDLKKGTDTKERLGPKRASQSGWLHPPLVLGVGLSCLLLSLVCGLPLIAHVGIPVSSILLVSALMGFFYTGGPFPLSYKGLGDLFVFLFFGLVATSAIFFGLTGTLTGSVVAAGAQIGLTATLMIAINNLRDIKGDAKANKRTIAVRFGKTCARIEITLLTILPYLIGLFAWDERPLIALLPCVTLPLAINLNRNIWKTDPSTDYNNFLAQSSLLHLFFGCTLSIGALLQ